MLELYFVYFADKQKKVNECCCELILNVFQNKVSFIWMYAKSGNKEFNVNLRQK
jgi:hypothetical protein